MEAPFHIYRFTALADHPSRDPELTIMAPAANTAVRQLRNDHDVQEAVLVIGPSWHDLSDHRSVEVPRQMIFAYQPNGFRSYTDLWAGLRNGH